MFTESQLKVIEYCTEEVRRQGDGPTNVYDMLNAWNTADTVFHMPIDLDFIETIGKLVEPNENPKGFRTIRIFVGNGWENIEKAPPDRIIPQLQMLLESYYAGSLEHAVVQARQEENWRRYREIKKAESAEDIFYYEFEQIHPFKDGNGRSGKIIYNYLKGTLDNPIWPPNFWNIPNP